MNEISKINVNGTSYDLRDSNTVTSVFDASNSGLAPAASNANKQSAESSAGNYYLCADGKYRQLPTNAFSAGSVDYDEETSNITSVDATIISTALRKTAQVLTTAEKALVRQNLGINANGNLTDLVVSNTTSGSIALTSNKVYSLGALTGALTVTLDSPEADTENVYVIEFDVTNTSNVPSFPATVVWKEEPTWEADKHYEITIKYATNAQVYYGSFIDFDIPQGE